MRIIEFLRTFYLEGVVPVVAAVVALGPGPLILCDHVRRPIPVECNGG